MFGILNINKPAGCTSRDVVSHVQRLVRPAKVGHAGTLDPLATGVLVVCVGPATRLIQYVQEMPKVYQATFLLGRSSRSDDIETDVTELVDPPQPTLANIEAQLPKFLGPIEQHPPMYSAIKIKGQRAYRLARSGQQVDLQPRIVEIYGLHVDSFVYPVLKVTMRCGSGTYVRSVGRDLAKSLGTRAVMSELVRTAIGDYLLGDACEINSLSAEQISERLLAPLSAVANLPQLEITLQQLQEIRHGRLFNSQESVANQDESSFVIAAIDPKGRLVALLQQRRPGMLGPLCNFVLPEQSV